jgi:rubredoxin
MVNGRDLLVQPRNVKERHFCDICDVIFEGEAGKHVNDEHGEEYHSSESMIEFEERHISEVD